MKISFQNQDFSKIDIPVNTNSAYKNPSQKTAQTSGSGIRMDIGNSPMVPNNNLFPGNDNKNKSGKTLTELQQEVGNIDVAVQQDYRTVMSNTMSPEDYAEAEKEGFHISAMDPDEVVTIQDRVKAEVAKGGTVIAGYNDDLEGQVLAEAVGSETLARSLQSAFSSADLPLTQENIEDIARSHELVTSLTEPTDASVAYMVENEMDPTVWNFYLAENSGVAKSNEQAPSIDLTAPENKAMAAQVETIVKETGREQGSSEFKAAMEDAQWLLDHQLPVTPESIDNYQDIKSVRFPIDDDTFVNATVAALSKGESPVYADLTETENIYSMALKAMDKYFSGELWEASAGNITMRRQLEEIRLSMTAEVNVRLIESGFAIDTAPMEELIDALKQAEKEVADKYFPELKESEGQKSPQYSMKEESALSAYRIMNSTNRAVAELADTPADNLGTFVEKSDKDVTLGSFYQKGLELKDTYEKSGEKYEALYTKAGYSYESLMTAPRADLGDSIKKAFVNAGELAAEAGVEASPENVRAVRILGYNQMEISQANIERIVAADKQVNDIINKMTPASVLNMIRDGINPLETSFAELTIYFDAQQTGGYEETAKAYSEFLYGLDMQDAITQEERDAFIGVYRLIDKIEKSDGAVVGAVVNQQASLDFANLLSAVRTSKVKKMDFKIDDVFGTSSEIIRAGKSITAQISGAFEQERYNDQLKELRAAVEVSREVAEALDSFNLVKSADNLVTMDNILSNDKNLYDELSKQGKKSDKVKEAAKKAEEALEKGDLDSEYDDIQSQLQAITEELTLETDSYIDIKALSLIHRQLGMIRSMSDINEDSLDKEYILPIEIGGTLSKVHLTLRTGEGGEAKADILAVLGEGETAEAHLSLKGDSLEGYFVGNSHGELQKLERVSDIFTEAINNTESLENLQLNTFPIIERDGAASIGNISTIMKPGKDATANDSEGSERSVLMQVTRIFLQSVGRVE